MTNDEDPDFYTRADAHIQLANEHLAGSPRGKVSASFLYGASRFNAWVSACKCDSADELQQAKGEIVDYFLQQYRCTLVENLDDYIRHFEKYMKTDAGDS